MKSSESSRKLELEVNMKKIYKLKEPLRQVILTRYSESGVEAVESFFNERASFILGSDTRYFRFFLNNRSLLNTIKDEIHFTPEDFEEVCVFDPNGWNVWPDVEIPKLGDYEFFVVIDYDFNPTVMTASKMNSELKHYRASLALGRNARFLFRVFEVDEEVRDLELGLRRIKAGAENEKS